jgi:RNA polymerase sigma-70 factor (ECF subfamily)
MLMIKGSARKLEDLYLNYNRILYKIAYGILKEHQFAQDAVQMTFIRIIENIKKIGEINCNKTKAFVVIICRNISYNIYNKRKHSSTLPIDEFDEVMPDNSFDLDEQLISRDRLSLLKGKIKLLYEPYADIITLKYIFEYSEKEISKMLDISEQNVRVRLNRAKNSLIKLINADEGADVV